MNTLLESGISLVVSPITISVFITLCSGVPEAQAITTAGNVAKRQDGIDNIVTIGSCGWTVGSKNGLALEAGKPTRQCPE